MNREEYEIQMLKDINNKINEFYIMYAISIQDYEEIAQHYKGIIESIKERARQLDFDLHKQKEQKK